MATYQEVFSYEFNSGSGPAFTKQGGPFDTWYVNWGERTLARNGEQETYVDPWYDNGLYTPFNIQNGVLTITAQPTPSSLAGLVGTSYVSGMLDTDRSFTQQYGYFEIRTQIPAGQGVWPAFWLMSDDSAAGYHEVDIFEGNSSASGTSTLYFSTHYGPPGSSGPTINNTVAVKLPFNYTSGMNTYGVLWTPQWFVLYIDGQPLAHLDASQFTGGPPMYMIANLAIGGNWVGQPNATTGSPSLAIDYIRAYQVIGGPAPAVNTTPAPIDPTTPAAADTLVFAPVVLTETATSAATILGVGAAATLTLTLSENVTVTGTPTLSLNDGGTATYASGSGTDQLVFNTVVQAGQNATALAVTAVNLSGTASIADATGTAADLSGAVGVPAGAPRVDTVAPTVLGVAATPANADLAVGQTVTLTLSFSETVSVAGVPTLLLNDGGSASYSAGSGSSTLTFKYKVAAGQNTPALAITGSSLPAGASITDAAGNAANLSAAIGTVPGAVQIDTTAPTVTSVTSVPAAGAFAAGTILTLTVNMSEVVTVAGAPVLKLNDAGSATYVSGSGTSALTFTYTVLPGQNTAALASSGITLPSGTSIKDGAGNAANLAGATASLPGTVVIDTKAPVVTEKLAVDTGWSTTDKITSNRTLTGTGDANAVVTFSEGSQVLGTTIALATGAWSFAPAKLADGTHTIVASETDAAGNTGSASLAFTLDTAAPKVTGIIATPANADLGTGQVVTFTVSLNAAVRVTGTPALTLNDGASATYSAGSGTGTLTFKYTVAAGQNTTALAVTGSSLPAGASIVDIAGNAADLSGVVAPLPGRLIVDTSSTRKAIASGTGQIVNAGTGNDVVVLSGGNATLAFHGSGNVAFLGGGTTAVNATVNDLSSGLTVYVANGGADVITGLTSDPSAVIDLLGGVGGYTSAANILASLANDGAGGSVLALGSAQSIHFIGIAPAALQAANFRIG